VATLSLQNLVKRFGKTEVLHGIDLEVADGEFIVFVGPSGCGKSTTLRMIAGLEDITDGIVQINGEVVNNLEPKQRNIAMVFQNYAIYPHMSVRKNIGFGLRTSKLPKLEKKQRVEEVATMLGMHDYLDRKPNELSGGQRQRVAIGRALVRNPAVFLFDEPLSNLDAQLRTQMRLEIKKLHQRVGNTIIFVTHDQVEAMTMADRIVIMKDGHIQQIATPADAYHKPANEFVARFIGAPSMNMLTGKSMGSYIELWNGARIPSALQSNLESGRNLTIGIRPEDLRICTDNNPVLTGRVNVVEPLGSESLLYVDVEGIEIIATGPGRDVPLPNTQIDLTALPESFHIFDPDTGESVV